MPNSGHFGGVFIDLRISMRFPHILLSLVLLSAASLSAASRPSVVTLLVDASCIDCHDSDTKTALNFDDLSFDLTESVF